MENNHTLRSLRYTLDLSEARIVHVLQLANYAIDKETVARLLLREDQAEYLPCTDEVMAHFLAGLVTLKRGVSDTHPPRPVEPYISNNVVLKKLRVAFELKEEDLHAIMRGAGFPLSKPELSALFRQEGQKNFRPCGDQILRNFLRGLTMRLQGNAVALPG